MPIHFCVTAGIKIGSLCLHCMQSEVTFLHYSPIPLTRNLFFFQTYLKREDRTKVQLSVWNPLLWLLIRGLCAQKTVHLHFFFKRFKEEQFTKVALRHVHNAYWILMREVLCGYKVLIYNYCTQGVLDEIWSLYSQNYWWFICETNINLFN